MKTLLKKVLIIEILILPLAINLYAQVPDTLWTKTYGGAKYDFGSSVQ